MGSVFSKPVQMAQSAGIVSPVSEPKTSSPTTAEVSQATTTDATGLKRRRRGRSATILTGASGLSEGATLGTPTLLG